MSLRYTNVNQTSCSEFLDISTLNVVTFSLTSSMSWTKHCGPASYPTILSNQCGEIVPSPLHLPCHKLNTEVLPAAPQHSPTNHATIVLIVRLMYMYMWIRTQWSGHADNFALKYDLSRSRTEWEHCFSYDETILSLGYLIKQAGSPSVLATLSNQSCRLSTDWAGVVPTHKTGWFSECAGHII